MISPSEFNEVTRIYQTLITQDLASGFSTSNCSIFIGTITGVMQGCRVNIVNHCTSGNSYLLLRKATEIVSSLKNKEEILGVFNQSIDNCKSQSLLLQNITVMSIDIGTCVGDYSFDFINSGSALANCHLEGLLSSALPSLQPTNEPGLITPYAPKKNKIPSLLIMIASVLGSIGLGLAFHDLKITKLETLVEIAKG